MAHPILELIQRCLARHVRFDRRQPGRDVLGVDLYLREPLRARRLLWPRRQAVQLSRPRRREDHVGGPVPVPDAVVGALHREGKTLARRLQGIVRGVEPAQLAHHDRQQQRRQQAEREGACRRTCRLSAPPGECRIDITRDHNHQRIIGYDPRRGKALDAVDRAAGAQWPGLVAGSHREGRVERRVRPAERVFHRRIAREQRPIAMEQGHGGRGIRPDVAVEVLEVGDQTSCANQAGKFAGRLLQPAPKRQRTTHRRRRETRWRCRAPPSGQRAELGSRADRQCCASVGEAAATARPHHRSRRTCRSRRSASGRRTTRSDRIAARPDSGGRGGRACTRRRNGAAPHRSPARCAQSDRRSRGPVSRARDRCRRPRCGSRARCPIAPASRSQR